MKTYSTKPSHVQARWHVFDAKDRILGRLATEVSVLLQGKHKPIYARHILTGDFVIVINASKIKVTGKKLQQKMYRRHSGYPGALRETTLARLHEKHPDRVIRAAVKGMLPGNTAGSHMLRRLKVYAGDNHPHEAQVRGSLAAEALSLAQDVQTRPATPSQPEILDVVQPLVVPTEEAPEAEAEAEVVAIDETATPVSEVTDEAAETPEDQVAADVPVGEATQPPAEDMAAGAEAEAENPSEPESQEAEPAEAIEVPTEESAEEKVEGKDD